jgi:hypothetical protein
MSENWMGFDQAHTSKMTTRTPRLGLMRRILVDDEGTVYFQKPVRQPPYRAASQDGEEYKKQSHRQAIGIRKTDSIYIDLLVNDNSTLQHALLLRRCYCTLGEHHTCCSAQRSAARSTRSESSSSLAPVCS